MFENLPSLCQTEGGLLYGMTLLTSSLPLAASVLSVSSEADQMCAVRSPFNQKNVTHGSGHHCGSI